MASKTTIAGLSGRRGEAARNNQRILDAARAVFTADPEAPIALVAERAGVGIGALYRRYRSKDELIQVLSMEGLQRYIAAAEAALADAGDAWDAFAGFMSRCVDAGTGSLTVRFAGAFTATEEMYRAGRKANELTQRLVARTKAAGALRADIDPGDFSLLIEQLQAVNVGDERRTTQLRHRYLALILQGLQAPGASPLPGPAPRWDELTRRYERR
jgi:AcrR family transcriptional regulator